MWVPYKLGPGYDEPSVYSRAASKVELGSYRHKLHMQIKHFFLLAVLRRSMYLVLAHLFVKVPRPGDSEGTFAVF